MARKPIVLTLIATMIMTGCGGGAVLRGPEAAAKAAFEEWAQANGIPYKDVKIQVMESDKAFAKVRIIARFKPGADAPWREKAANIECRNVGGKWQADSTMSFVPIMQVIKQLPLDEQIELYYESALGDLEDGNFWEAAYKLRQVVEANPDYRDARKLLAKAREKNGRFLIETKEDDQTVLWLMAADGGERQEMARGDIFGVRTVVEQNLWDRYEAEEDSTRYVYFIQDKEGKGALYYVDINGVSPALIEGLDVEHYV